jgi:hypothetical protein
MGISGKVQVAKFNEAFRKTLVTDACERRLLWKVRDRVRWNRLGRFRRGESGGDRSVETASRVPPYGVVVERSDVR